MVGNLEPSFVGAAGGEPVGEGKTSGVQPFHLFTMLEAGVWRNWVAGIGEAGAWFLVG